MDRADTGAWIKVSAEDSGSFTHHQWQDRRDEILQMKLTGRSLHARAGRRRARRRAGGERRCTSTSSTSKAGSPRSSSRRRGSRCSSTPDTRSSTAAIPIASWPPSRMPRLTRIDYLLVTHLHEDHNGGVAELPRRLPIGTFVDYGTPMETAPEVVAVVCGLRGGAPHARASRAEARRSAAVPRRRRRRRERRRRDADAAARRRRPAESGVRGRRGRRRQSGARTRGRSASASRYGAFRFLDLGDLIRNRLGDLVCPANLIGADRRLPRRAPRQQRPQSAGDARGAAAEGGDREQRSVEGHDGRPRWRSCTRSAGLEDVWQLHHTINDGAENFPDAFIANLTVQRARRRGLDQAERERGRQLHRHQRPHRLDEKLRGSGGRDQPGGLARTDRACARSRSRSSGRPRGACPRRS